jgi:hypothetical protein
MAFFSRIDSFEHSSLIKSSMDRRRKTSMVERIDYQLEKYSFADVNETPRIEQQWAEVIKECHQVQAGNAERLRIALLNVDYVTSFELPFRLLLVRGPQLIAGLRDELPLSQKNVVFNGKRFGCVYSMKSDTGRVSLPFVNSHSPGRGVRRDRSALSGDCQGNKNAA